MGYKIVAVNPLKPFPLPTFGISRLANVASLADAAGQIRNQFLKAAGLRIDSANVFTIMSGDICPAADDCVERQIRVEYEKAGENEIVRLETRWDEGKIQPALDLHLARQERRKKHFDSACRLEGCNNPHPLGTLYYGVSRISGRVAHRHGAPLFCGAHAWLRKSITQEILNKLHASSANRVRLV